MGRYLRKGRDFKKNRTSSSGDIPIGEDGCVDEDVLKEALSANTSSVGDGANANSGSKRTKFLDKNSNNKKKKLPHLRK